MIKAYTPGQGRNNAHGAKAEKKLAKRLGARLTPASGALEGAKGDMTHGDFRTESKATVKDSYRMDYADLCKIASEAAEKGQVPSFTVQFVSPDGKPRNDGSWVCLPEYVFKELLGGGE